MPKTYAEKWPNHCRSCNGWGVTTFSQSVPYGSTSASFDTQDPCDACTMHGKCARCGERGLACEENGDDEIITGEGPCKLCGWNYDDGEFPKMPMAPPRHRGR